MLNNLIVLIVGSLIVWFVQDHFKDVPAVTYSVSDGIEIVGSQGKSEYAQEIAVLNSGKRTANTVSVKIPRHISSYKLTKHSSLIVEKAFSEADSFELVYPELPTAQKIRLLVRYDGSPISSDWISINHADGNAQPQDKQSSKTNYLWIWIAFWLGLGSNIILDIRSFKKKWFRNWPDSKALFRDDKPWFCTASEWKELQAEAIERSLERYSYDPIEQRLSYLLLSRVKPALMPDEQWSKLQQQAVKLLKEHFSREVTTYASREKLLDLLKIKKPESFPLESWNEVQKSIHVLIKAALLPEHIKSVDLAKILEDNSPALRDLPEALAADIRERARLLYFRNSIEKCIDDYRSLQNLDDVRLDLLNNDQQTQLNEVVVKAARMRNMPRSWNIQGLQQFISQGKPGWMSDGEFDDVRSLVLEANSLSNDRDNLNRRQSELADTSAEVGIVKQRVLAQLSLIDRVLTNPISIDNLEDYDATFAPGNRRNLERVASILRDGLPAAAAASAS
jgi:hypothetical protein